jgi:phosphatidylinositol glycan class N
MAQLGRYRFLAIAVVFHLIYIYRSAFVTAGAIASANDGSIFSIYFVSPIVHGMREHRVENQEAPAKRLVLFVGPSRSSGGSFKN